MKKIWLHKPVDLPGSAQATIIDCSPPRAKNLPFYVANFVPAHQVIELEYYRNEASDPYRTRLALVSVDRFD